MSILIKHVLNLSNIQAIRFRGLSFSSPIYNRQLIAKPDWTMRSRREVFCNERNSHRTRFITPRAKNHSLRLCTYTHSNTCKACHVIVLLHFTRGSLSCHHVEVYGRRRGRQGNGNRRRQFYKSDITFKCLYKILWVLWTFLNWLFCFVLQCKQHYQFKGLCTLYHSWWFINFSDALEKIHTWSL